MAHYGIKSSEGARARDNHPSEPIHNPGDAPKASTLILTAEAHLMTGVSPLECGCRHLVKPALAEVHKYPRAILEHKTSDGETWLRVIKENGFSCPPYYVDENDNRIEGPTNA
jgi:hypothetical protein